MATSRASSAQEAPIAFEFRQRRHRRYWIHLVNQRRETHGVYGHLVHEICDFSSYHRRYLQMTVKNFDQTLSKFNKVLLYRILQQHLLWILQRILQQHLCTVVCHFLSACACQRAQNQPIRWHTKKQWIERSTRPTSDKCLTSICCTPKSFVAVNLLFTFDTFERVRGLPLSSVYAGCYWVCWVYMRVRRFWRW